VRCRGDGACDGTVYPSVVDGSRATQLRLLDCDRETSGDTPACNSMEIHCPSYDAQQSPQCFIPGDGSYAIYERDAVSGTLAWVSGGINIWARHSWQDITLTNYDASHATIPIAGTMYCEDGRYECDIVNSNTSQWEWDCRNTSRLCSRDEYTTDPTMEPTLDPTTLPTFSPTVDPTQTPTTDPTIPPSADPTSEPTTPTQTPTSDPTSEPTIEPTRNPTDEAATITVPIYGRFGLLIGMLVIVVFICLIGYTWKWWNKQDAMDVMQLDEVAVNRRQNSMVNDGGDGATATATTTVIGHDKKKTKKKKDRKKKKKKNREDKEWLAMDEHAVEIELQMHDDAAVQTSKVNGDDKKAMKTTKKKKKKKKKKHKEDKVALMDDNAGDYRKQNDDHDPFETNQWTELDKFD